MRLVCIPFAGASHTIFKPWADSLPAAVGVHSLVLPGRGELLGQVPFRRITPVIDYAIESLLQLRDHPIALFGHSMGALIAFELARRLQNAHGVPACHLFVSGRPAPHLSIRSRCNCQLPDEEFLQEVVRLGGVPTELETNAELLEIFLPILKADFSVCQTYAYTTGAPLQCPITALGGTRDAEVRPEHLVAWREHTTAGFSLHMIEGDHFFIQSAFEAVLAIVDRELRKH